MLGANLRGLQAKGQGDGHAWLARLHGGARGERENACMRGAWICELGTKGKHVAEQSSVQLDMRSPPCVGRNA